MRFAANLSARNDASLRHSMHLSFPHLFKGCNMKIQEHAPHMVSIGSTVHIRDLAGLPNGRNSKDVEWIEYLRRSNDHWIFISGDSRILKNPAELAALRSAGLHGFVLAPAYQKTPLHQVASLLVWRWPEIVQITKLIQPPSVHEIPIKKTTRMRVLL